MSFDHGFMVVGEQHHNHYIFHNCSHEDDILINVQICSSPSMIVAMYIIPVIEDSTVLEWPHIIFIIVISS